MIDKKTVREEKEMADILSRQYENICSEPRENINSSEFYEFLCDNSDIDNTCKPRKSNIFWLTMAPLLHSSYSHG